LGEVLTTPPREKHLLRNIHKARCFLWRQNNPEVNYSPPLGSPGGGVSRGDIFGKWEGVETGWSWLRIGTDGGHLRIR